jgi:hypothetical protein
MESLKINPENVTCSSVLKECASKNHVEARTTIFRSLYDGLAFQAL